MDPGPQLLYRVLFTSIAMGVAAIAVGRFVYRLDGSLLTIMFLGIVAGGPTMVAAAQFQLGHAGSAVYGWSKLIGERSVNRGVDDPFLWGETMSYAGVSGVGIALVQLERLVIPKGLTLEDLDAAAALAHFHTLPGVDLENIFIMGHSAGWRPALSVGIAEGMTDER